jgi:hypothetical protein
MKTKFSNEALNGVRMAQMFAHTTSLDLLPREMLKNAIDAGAKHVTFGEHADFPKKLAMWDDGAGVAASNVVDRLALPGGVPKDAQHFATGLRLLAMALANLNRDEYPYLTFVTQEKSGDATQIDVYYDGYETKTRPRLGHTRGSGSLTIIQGNSLTQDTLTNRPFGDGKHKNDYTWIGRALGSRFLDLPDTVIVKAPTMSTPHGGRIHGLFELLVKDGCEILPSTQVGDFKVTTVLNRTTRDGKQFIVNHTNFNLRGLPTQEGGTRLGAQVFHVMDGEIMGRESGQSSPVERFGVLANQRDVILFVEPTNRKKYIPSPCRTHIVELTSAGDANQTFNLEQVGVDFEKKHPRELVAAILKGKARARQSAIYSSKNRNVDRLVAYFGEVFVETYDRKKGSTLQPIDPQGPGAKRKKGLNLPRTGECPRLANLQSDPEHPLPSFETGGPGGNVVKPSKKSRTKKFVEKIRTLQIPHVDLNKVDLNPEDPFLHIVRRTADTITVDLNVNSRALDFLQKVQLNVKRGATREEILGVMANNGGIIEFRILSILARARMFNASPEPFLTDDALSAALCDVTILDKVNFHKSKESEENVIA